MKKLILIATTIVILFGMLQSAQALETTVPQSALTASNFYYTDSIGGGLGTQAVMTGGGNAANVGQVRNDDGFRGPLNLGFQIEFFGMMYDQYWANNNGNISFTEGLAQFTPTGVIGASVPVMSPFFADVDTRNASSGVMWIRDDIPNQLIVTWDQVGYYSSHADLLNSFQLVLRGPDYPVPVGEGSIGFFYKDMQWETGDASGGSGGFGGTPGAVGFGNGTGDGVVLEGSMQNGIAQVVDNTHIWFDPLLEPIPPPGIPEPVTLLLVGTGLVGLVGFRRKFKRD